MKKALLGIVFLFNNFLQSHAQKFGLNYNDTLWQKTLVANLSQLTDKEYNTNYQYYSKIADSLLNVIAKDVEENGFNLYNTKTGEQTRKYDNYLEYIELKLQLNEKNIFPIKGLPNIYYNTTNGWKKTFASKVRDIQEAIQQKKYYKKFNIIDSLSSIAAYEIYKLPKENQIECWIDLYKVIIQQRDSIPESWDFPTYFYYPRMVKRDVLNTSFENLWDINYSLNNIKEQVQCGLQIFEFYQQYEMKKQMDQTLVRLFSLGALRDNPNLFYEIISKTSNYLVVAENKELSLSICSDSLLTDNALSLKNLNENTIKKVDEDSNYSFKVSDFPLLIFYNPDVNRYITHNNPALTTLFLKFKIWSLYIDMGETSELLSQLALWQVSNNWDKKFPFHGHIFWEHIMFSKAYRMKTIDEQLWVLQRYCLLQIEKGNWQKANSAFENYFSRNFTINSLDDLTGNIQLLIQNNLIGDNNGLKKLMDMIYKVYMNNSINKKNEDRLFSNYNNTWLTYYLSPINVTNKLDSVYKYGYLAYKFNDNLHFADQYTEVIDDYWNRINYNQVVKHTMGLHKDIDSLQKQYIRNKEEYQTKMFILKSDYEKSKLKYLDSLKTKSNKLDTIKEKLDSANQKYIEESSKNARTLKIQRDSLKSTKDSLKKVDSILTEKNAELVEAENLIRIGLAVSIFSGILLFFSYIRNRDSLKRKEANYKLELLQKQTEAIMATLNPHFIKTTIGTAYLETKEMNEMEKYAFFDKLHVLVSEAYQYHEEREKMTTIAREAELCNYLVDFYNTNNEHKNKHIKFSVQYNYLKLGSLPFPKMLLFNHIENSVQEFSGYGNRKKEIVINAIELERGYQIEIIDNGHGIDIEHYNNSVGGALSKNEKLMNAYNANPNTKYYISRKLDSDFTNEKKGTKFIIIFKLK